MSKTILWTLIIRVKRVQLRVAMYVTIALCVYVFPAAAQDDITTHNAASAYGGGYITGPASNPLSFLNGPAYRTTASAASYDFPDFRPASLLDEKLPRWILFGWEERFRDEGYSNGGFKLGNNDSYMLLRTRFQMTIQPAKGVKIVAQVQDARPFFRKTSLWSSESECLGFEAWLCAIWRSRDTVV